LDAESRTALSDDQDGWSAVTISNGVKHVVILNSAHSRARASSDLAHELSHIIIGHGPGRVDITEDGTLVLNTYQKEQEDEANWLSGCLLLPREALLWARRQGLASDDAAQLFGVSAQMLDYRYNVTGVRVQFRRNRGRSPTGGRPD
jgi:Zn-dependent peptidase ImmA (M78 family)